MIKSVKLLRKSKKHYKVVLVDYSDNSIIAIVPIKDCFVKLNNDNQFLVELDIKNGLNKGGLLC